MALVPGSVYLERNVIKHGLLGATPRMAIFRRRKPPSASRWGRSGNPALKWPAGKIPSHSTTRLPPARLILWILAFTSRLLVISACLCFVCFFLLLFLVSWYYHLMGSVFRWRQRDLTPHRRLSSGRGRKFINFGRLKARVNPAWPKGKQGKTLVPI